MARLSPLAHGSAPTFLVKITQRNANIVNVCNDGLFDPRQPGGIAFAGVKKYRLTAAQELFGAFDLCSVWLIFARLSRTVFAAATCLYWTRVIQCLCDKTHE